MLHLSEFGYIEITHPIKITTQMPRTIEEERKEASNGCNSVHHDTRPSLNHANTF